jgi:hypothetical protein
VVEKEEKKERSMRERDVGREYRGEKISKEDGLWTTHQVEKATNG